MLMKYQLLKALNLFSKICIFFIFSSNFCFSNSIDYILISKSKRELSIIKKDKVIETFKVSLGFEPIGKKTKQGDGKTPEGLYYIEKKVSNSAFFLALKISYPNPWDIRQAITRGHHPGGQIMIHGVPNKNFDKNYHNIRNDWTDGCIAINNSQMKFLWNKTDIGIPVLIKK